MGGKYKPVVLVVMDGVGVSASPESTLRHADMPVFREMEKFFPFTTLQASGVAVGLPWGEEGNSEVGHLTIGAGKTLYHHLPRIITSIHNESFFQNPAFLEAALTTKKHNGALHFMGLFSSGSVHAYVDHLYALLEFAKTERPEKVYLHLFTDGKDAPPKEGSLFLRQLEERLFIKYPFAKIATVSGRFYAMDRDENWGRVDKIYKCLTEGECNAFKNPSLYVEEQYASNLTDESIPPAALESGEGRIKSGDAAIFFNFREDSARELTSLFLKNKEIFFVTMTEYDTKFKGAKVAFPTLDIPWPLTRIIAEAGMKQLHIAETEKYAHVTYFFNGGKETSFQGEERVLVPSPRTVRFDEAPEMSAEKITENVLENMSNYDFILTNFANGDMVGHTGNFNATAKALEIIDVCLGKLKEKIMELGGVMIVTADHGNAEEKIYSSGEKRTKHTANPVPFFVVAQGFKSRDARDENQIHARYSEVKGVLSDIAPTILSLMELRKPDEMTGVDLLPKILG